MYKIVRKETMMAESANPRKSRAFLYSLIGIGFVVLVAFTGILLGANGVDIQLTQTYFVVAHLHWLNILALLVVIAGIIFLLRRRSAK